MNTPHKTKELIEMLHRDNPHRCPSPHMTERDIWLYAGRRQLIDDLIGMAQEDGIQIDLHTQHKEEDE